MKIFLISPVKAFIKGDRKYTYQRIKRYVKKLEKRGHRIHWPIRDTNQDDPVGLRICRDNCRAIIHSDEIHIWYDPDSSGSKFDFGMAFMLCELLANLGIRKKIVLANPKDISPTETKSFENVLLALNEAD